MDKPRLDLIIAAFLIGSVGISFSLFASLSYLMSGGLATLVPKLEILPE